MSVLRVVGRGLGRAVVRKGRAEIGGGTAALQTTLVCSRAAGRPAARSPAASASTKAAGPAT